MQMEADEQIVDYLLLKFECLAIEEEEQADKDSEAEQSKRSALFVQHFGLLDEKLLECMTHVACGKCVLCSLLCWIVP